MIVCSCKATTDREINRTIDRGAQTLEQVAQTCGAGTGCGQCHAFICGMLEAKNKHATACECKFAKEQAA